MSHEDHDAVAVIGMAGRFPGARNLDAFWENLRGGVESITFFSDDELAAFGVDRRLLAKPHFVKAAPILLGDDEFDADFFGLAPREAEMLDPQHRLFLEGSVEALDSAGHGAGSRAPSGSVGVYAGTSLSSYLLYNLLPSTNVDLAHESFPLMLANDKDFLATRVSYHLDLKGPSVDVQTGCSTSLVAVHLAVEALLSFQCDLALAGGVSVQVPRRRGYFYQEGGILSPDGHCRPFDAAARGTLFGSGVGLVVLKRLAEAQEDGDPVRAVIRGSAINNDGAHKVGYTAPSVDGQAEVIARAQEVADVDPASIGYVEAHGTGTPLGDPVEVAALHKAFGDGAGEPGSCALGSVKSNIGHLDAAAGIAGLIKTVLALEHRQIPPSLHFERPNPKIDFASTPFQVAAELREWPAPAAGGPRRAGVSSFGIGGTNAHVVLEEAPRPGPRPSPLPEGEGARRPRLLLLSARTEEALAKTTEALAGHLERHPETDRGDAAFTLHEGRRAFERRRSIVAGKDTPAALRATRGARIAAETPPPVVFLFPGQGAQVPGMGRELYLEGGVYRAEFDRCAELLGDEYDLDLRGLVLPSADDEASAARLRQTRHAQPALFAVGWSLARQLMAWGVAPAALAGHSIGEWVAAALAGVFDFEDALRLVAERGRAMHAMPPGAMLSVALGEAALADELAGHGELSLAAINAPERAVVAGPEAAVTEFAERLAARGVEARRLHTAHAFHSSSAEPLIDPFVARVDAFHRRAPEIPFTSNVSGTWTGDEEAKDPARWGRQMRQPVRFADNLATLLEDEAAVLVEVGPGDALTQLARRQPASTGRLVVPTLAPPRRPRDARTTLLEAAGGLWTAGVDLDPVLHGAARRRVPLPSRPFARRRFWIEPEAAGSVRPDGGKSGGREGKRADAGDWFYLPSWRRVLPPALDSAASERILLFRDPSSSLAMALEKALAAVLEREELVTVEPGERFARRGQDLFVLAPEDPQGYRELLAALRARPGWEGEELSLIHAWTLGIAGDAALACGFGALVHLGRELATGALGPARITVVADGLHAFGGVAPDPDKAALRGPALVVPQELAGTECRTVDVVSPLSGSPAERRLAERLAAEALFDGGEPAVAWRDSERWAESFEPVRLAATEGPVARSGGVYLILGGWGEIGFALARELAGQGARLALASRSAPPAERHGLLAELGEVLPLVADAADHPSLAAAVARTKERFGRLDGVIHAAGAVDEAVAATLGETDPATWEELFRPKVAGLAALDEALVDEKLDFVLLISSLSVVLGGLGLAGYAAAHFYLDAFAARRRRDRETPWRVIDFDAWQRERRSSHALAGALARYELDVEEGVEVFRRFLAADVGRLVVSTGDLEARLERWRRPANAESAPSTPRERHSRPELETNWVAPRNELESSLAEIWGAVLGVEGIGVEDDFFALGGDSLLATRVTARIRDTLGLSPPLSALLENPTVAGLAELVETLRWASEAPAETAGVVEEGEI